MSLEPIVSVLRSIGAPSLAAILGASGVVIVHSWRLEARAETVAKAVAEQKVASVIAQAQAQAGELVAVRSEQAVQRAQVAAVDAGVRAEVRLVREELAQLRIGQDRAREEDRRTMNSILLEVRKR